MSKENEYEAYAQDAFKVSRNFTVTYGLRYSLYGVPYEKNGQQVVPQTPLSDYSRPRANGIRAIDLDENDGLLVGRMVEDSGIDPGFGSTGWTTIPTVVMYEPIVSARLLGPQPRPVGYV